MGFTFSDQRAESRKSGEHPREEVAKGLAEIARPIPPVRTPISAARPRLFGP
jgi:hypothetical protein